MNVDIITSKVLALPESGCDETVARQIARNCVQFFASPRTRIQPRIKHNPTLPRTVMRTHTHCIYMLQDKGGAELLGTGEYSKVGRVLVIDQKGMVRIDAGRVVFDNIEGEKRSDTALQRYQSPFLDKAAWATFDYYSLKTEGDESGEEWGSEKKELRCLFVKECLAFDGVSDKLRALPVRMQLSILADVAEGLAVLHEDDSAHNDVKPSNFRVRIKTGASHEGVLADMGFLKKMGSESLQGSPIYCPPEYFTEYQSTAARDVWAFGLSVYQILKNDDAKVNDRLPRFIKRCVRKAEGNVTTFGRLLKQVQDTDLTPEKLFPQGWSILADSSYVERIIKRCFSLIPADRQTARQISQLLREAAQAIGS